MSSKDSVNSFGARDTLQVGDSRYEIYRLDAVAGTERLPYSLKVLAENLLRTEDGTNITADHINAIASWDPAADPSIEIQFTPARVIMQDFTGVPCIVDLATMREAVGELGGDTDKVNPLAPAELVIDHSVIVDVFGRADAFERNVDIEYSRNGERYQFLRWGQGAFDDFKVVPPGTGIVHQVNVFTGDQRWRNLPTPAGNTFDWDPNSTYVRKPPYFEGMPAEPAPVTDITGARVLALLGDSVTTDHISPAGNIKAGTPAAQYLEGHGVDRKDYNSYGSRRGNHEVMIRGTFANIRLRNQLLTDVAGGYTRDFTQQDGPQAFIYDAAQNYAAQGIPLVVLGGKEYGSGSSRDWAAKGTSLLGVKAVIVESFERIHRSNLIGMGVVPLQFPPGESAASLKLTGTEVFDITGITALNDGKTPKTVHVTATSDDGSTKEFEAVIRIDTPGEADYYRNGGILQYVLRNMLKTG